MNIAEIYLVVLCVFLLSIIITLISLGVGE